jgi:hypothetical protein
VTVRFGAKLEPSPTPSITPAAASASMLRAWTDPAVSSKRRGPAGELLTGRLLVAAGEEAGQLGPRHLGEGAYRVGSLVPWVTSAEARQRIAASCTDPAMSVKVRG